jgi:phosphopantothenoylcysteine synthetase/decarboxylase
MNLLVTAGNTLTPIDRVRCITNVFTGRTGTRIALEANARGHAVTLLTSHPDVVAEMQSPSPAERWTVFAYRTFDNLEALMAEQVAGRKFDAVIHSAAVSDYRADGVYAPAEGTHFDPAAGHWHAAGGGVPSMADMTGGRSVGKVKSDAPEVWLRLVRTPKLVDRVREDWGFRGVLVKFKLEVGVSEERLLEIAENSREHSHADLMVANTLEGAATWAFLGPVAGRYQKVSRAELAGRLLGEVERLHAEKGRG